MDMLKKLSQNVYDFFIPTERNHMIPGGMNKGAFLTYIILGFAISASSLFMGASQFATPIDIVGFTPARVIELLNSAREAAGLSPLAANTLLDQGAERKAEDMFARQYFAHVTPDNKQPWDFFRAVGYPYFAAGENLAIDFTNPDAAHTALMNSPTHRANILNPVYNEIGVSVVPGTFKDHTSIIVVQFFGKQKAAPVTVAATPPPAVAPKAPAVSVPPPAQTPNAAVAGTETQVTPEKTSVPAEVAPVKEDLQKGKGGSEAIRELAPQETVEIQAITATQEPQEQTSAANPVRMNSGISFVTEVRLFSLLVILLTLIPAAMFVLRTGENHSRLLLRPLIIVAFFVYLGWFGGIVEAARPGLSPAAESTADCTPLVLPCGE